jgi:hypothetical protein
MNCIPTSMVAGDTALWVEPSFNWQGAAINSSDYDMVIELRGPGPKVTIAGVANGDGWGMVIDPAISDTLQAGIYSWSKRVTASGIRITVGLGQMTVKPDLAKIDGSYDGRTQAQKALADAKAALAKFDASGGKTISYSIAGRSKTFASITEIKAVISFWQQQVNAENGHSTDVYATFTKP